MPCPIFDLNLQADANRLKKMLERRNKIGLSAEESLGVEAKVREILTRVEHTGLDTVLEYTREFDCPDFKAEQFKVLESDIAKAAREVPEEDLAIIRAAVANIQDFHAAQQEKSWFMTKKDGTVLGQLNLPIERAGLYIPGGRGGNTPLISSLLMTAIPAQVAGVDEIAIVSPPRTDGSINPYILAVASILGINEVYACGSAWAIGALAFGAGALRPVDIIAGPGNIWVSTAKRLLIGRVGIDMLAGPSEISIYADATAKPEMLAADMLSQAEHDELASAICVVHSQEQAEKIKKALEKQCQELPRAELAASSLHNWGALVVAPDLNSAMQLINKIAPEHLELMCDNPWEILPHIRHAGAVFMGKYSAEPMGDYYAGPNHVLPTMSTARFASALGVQTFCKKTSIIAASETFAQNGSAAIARMARLEALEAHARSAEIRLK